MKSQDFSNYKMAEITAGRETALLPPKLLEIMADNMSDYLYKKWECPNKIAVEGGRGVGSGDAVAAPSPEGSAEFY
ncbi:hypothetical protein [Candidatus Cetobacterium colombiensis]|uniref:Uncharacterized protein n=1 Tax=Candidatus Cetobacterium colombiensis TaxID=3073100 RepID=A0ABU4WCF9_9FUSO|nr:hypothetical protein [Candidatus Cetobacterium colombiensis]MDX8337217.1 hypothetical protein [Candidatus Cetobacterium colombiensis]